MHPPTDSQVSRVPTQRTPPEHAETPPVAPAPAPRRRRLGLVLAVVGGALALVCLAGAAIAYVAYDRFTAPDRSAPDVLVDNYLRAFLVDENDVLAGEFECADAAGLAPLRQLRADLTAREKQFQITFVVKWGPLDMRVQGERADVSVQLVISYLVDNLSQTEHQRWRFGVVQDDGWRVCTADPVS
ncbi:hypothetical protein O7626_36365 [Micromonospora sp. WMMD1102]|uniref:hypothetical protein n=1 Tax=Micromonospora sp. WMMD1102 TaxID=3016105 RepID=UPI0024155972|nr:hypothetical protein [Micromonospora sp. WMMD1102]MDG4791307.1 hypothetical protein [Micromonospora sp. WMMD1102]